MMRTALLWLRMYPLVVAWIAVAVLDSVVYTAGIMAPAAVLGFLSSGLLKQWALQHNALSTFAAVLGSSLLIRWAAKTLIPGLGDENTWPSADLGERAAIQQTLHRLPVFSVLFSLWAMLILTALFADSVRALHLSAFVKVEPYFLVFASSLVLALRGIKQPQPKLSTDRATA